MTLQLYKSITVRDSGLLIGVSEWVTGTIQIRGTALLQIYQNYCIHSNIMILERHRAQLKRKIARLENELEQNPPPEEP